MRHTHLDGNLYATALAWPGDELTLSIPAHVNLDSAPEVTLLTADGERACEISLNGGTLTMSLPAEPDHDHAYTVRLDGVTNPREQ